MYNLIEKNNEVLNLSLDGFEGPIDLLLSLARDQKIDLSKLSILPLAEQYLKFLDFVIKKDIDIAAEYLVMGAWLAFLKSKILLPDDNSDDLNSSEELSEILEFQMKRLEAIQKDLGVISNNIANANTNGFKRSRSEFVDMYSKALSDNPNSQSGLGALFQGTQKQMLQGSPIMTGGALDLNISGRGFFILSPKVGSEPRFTRDGSMGLDAYGNLITTDGFNIAGYKRDEIDGIIKTRENIEFIGVYSLSIE